MKRLTTLFCVFIALGINSVRGNNDTLLIADAITPLNETIVGDTLENGDRAHKVYVLKHTTKYFIKTTIKNFGYKLDIIGEDVPQGIANHPAIITGTEKDDAVYQNVFIVAQEDISVKNIYFMGWAGDNVGKASVIVAQMKDSSTNVLILMSETIAILAASAIAETLFHLF